MQVRALGLGTSSPQADTFWLSGFENSKSELGFLRQENKIHSVYQCVKVIHNIYTYCPWAFIFILGSNTQR